MSFATQPIPYPAAKDYGSPDRWPTLAVVWHVAEARNVAQYLARDPLRGVSVHYTVEHASALVVSEKATAMRAGRGPPLAGRALVRWLGRSEVAPPTSDRTGHRYSVATGTTGPIGGGGPS